MLKIHHNGALGYITQLLWTKDADPAVVAMSICGREVTVRALVAHFLNDRHLPVTMDGHTVHLFKQGKFKMKGKRLSPQIYQVMLWCTDMQKTVIRKKDFASFIENKYLVPFHSKWADVAWNYFIEHEMIDLLNTYGTEDTFYDVRFAEETLQSYILSHIDDLKPLLSRKAA